MKSSLLQDKIIFLTGGSCGIGRDCAKAYVAEGAKVVVVAIDKDGVAEAVAELGPEHLGIVCDVTSDAEVKQAVEKALKQYGRLDAVHNNAGISSPSKPVHETTDAEWDEVFNVNLKGVLHTTRHAFSALVASKGSILNTSSLVGVIGQEIHAAYTATKGGMNALTKSMALDYTKYGIRVNAVCPSSTWTPWTYGRAEARGMSLEELKAKGAVPCLLGRWAEPEEVAFPILWLASSEASFITGAALPVDGGLTAA
jgi:NAD(P)-dependent dehydrogenase (short-subunit alcohol dehydrogenase family)